MAEKAVFYDDLLKHFKLGLNNDTLFNNTITEIENLRRSSGLETNHVMQAVLKALLMLPVTVSPSNQEFDNYLPSLTTVLQKFQVLVSHFAKKQDAQKNYLHGFRCGLNKLIAGAVIKKHEQVIQTLSICRQTTSLEFPEVHQDIRDGKYGEVDDNGNIKILVPLNDMQDEMCINSSQTDEQSSTEEEECDSGEDSDDNGSVYSRSLSTDSYLADDIQLPAEMDGCTYITRNNIFRKDKEKEFTSACGKLYCCSECKDYLKVPAQAVPEGEVYKVVQSFPFLCCNNKRWKNADGIRPVCVKEFREVQKRPFLVHVSIVAHFATDLDSEQILVRYSAPNGTYEEAYLCQKPTSKQTSQLPDVYFTVSGKTVTIYTNHFTVFIIETKKSFKRFFSKSPTQRIINLVVQAYFAENVDERNVVLRVYVRDTECKGQELLKADTEKKEKLKRRCCVDDEILKCLPETINHKTMFQCTISCCQTKWKKLISTLPPSNLNKLLPDEAKFLKVDTSADLGTISDDALPAGHILKIRTDNQPCLGEFHLKYEVHEREFAPLIIIKTETVQTEPQTITTMSLVRCREKLSSLSAHSSRSSSSVSLNQSDELKLVYREAFAAEWHDYIRCNVNLKAGSWMKDLNTIIDKECRERIDCELRDSEKGIVLVQYLIQQNDIAKYNRFIDIWKQQNPIKAIYFEKALKKKIEDRGL